MTEQKLMGYPVVSTTMTCTPSELYLGTMDSRRITVVMNGAARCFQIPAGFRYVSVAVDGTAAYGHAEIGSAPKALKEISL